MPDIFHVADPDKFWEADLAPSWAKEQGWFYGDSTFPTKEAPYREVDNILARHPTLILVFAHFHFLSADLDLFGGSALPREDLERIYHGSIERLFGPEPAPLNKDAAMGELMRMASQFDEQSGGQAAGRLARHALEALQDM